MDVWEAPRSSRSGLDSGPLMDVGPAGARLAPPDTASMLLLTRRRLLIAVPLVVLLPVAAAVLLLAGGPDLKSRSALVSVGMPREQVEAILGPPVLVLRRTAGRGAALIWTDQLWQVDVLTGPDGRAESVGCKPSDSLCRRTVGRLIPLPE
jgi:hypothetical protein